jgi:hypothetical protein
MYELLGGLPTNVFIDNAYMQTSRPFDIEEDGWMLDQLKPTDFIAVKIGRLKLVGILNILLMKLIILKENCSKLKDN